MTNGGPRTFLGAGAGILLLLACQRTVWAHGEFPEATGVVFERDADPLPLVVTSFGILAPRKADDWTWVCEEVTGETSVTSFAALPSGRWFLGTFYGLWYSDDRCRWQAVPGDLDGRFVTQVQRDAVDPDRVWAATSNGDRDNALWRSDDGGDSFAAYATFGTGAMIRGFLQGSDGVPWYVFGWRDQLPWLWHSADGEDWTEHLIDALPEGHSIYPLGIDSQDSSRAYVEFHGYYGDSLVRITAEGSLAVLLDVADDVTAFATGPADGEIWAGGRNVGWYHSTDDGQSWDGPDPEPEAGCVIPHGDDWYLCQNNWADGAAVAVAPAGATEGEAVLEFGDVHGVEDCPDGSETQEVCGPLWESTKEYSGLDAEVPAEDVSTADADPGCGGCAHAGRPGGFLPMVGTLGSAAFALRRRRGRRLPLRSGTLVAVALVAALASACEPPTAGNPSVQILTPADGAIVCGDPLEVAVEVENFELVEEEADPYAAPDGTGHVHIFLNGQEAVQESQEEFDLPDPVPDGEYQVKAELANANHSPVEPYTSDLIYVTVSADACGD